MSDQLDAAAPLEDAPTAPPAAEPAPQPSDEPEVVAAAAAPEPEPEEAAASLEPEPPSLEPESPELIVLRQALEAKDTVEGQVIGWNKGGYHVALGRVAAFCPVSQIEIGSPRAPKKYLDKTFRFLVIEIQRGGKRVVVSRSAALLAEKAARAAEVREKVKPGQEVTGKVSSITDFGAFVEIGAGIEGLIHVSELSRRRVEHARELLQVGQEVRALVLKLEKGGERISLSMKRLEGDPWDGVGERFPAGTKHTGTVLRKADFGLFVEVEPGIEGLVHVSRFPHGKTLESEELQAGKSVDVWVHDVEPKRRRLSLSLRDLGEANPWQGILDRFPVGSVVSGTVERLAPFGAFIELEPGLTGLLPFSSLGGPPGANPRRQYHAGREVKVKILSIDKGKKRISLGTETSTAEGSEVDYREYMKSQRTAPSTGLNSLAAAFAKLKEQQPATRP